MDQWYYLRCGKEAGPVSLEELKHLVLLGQIGSADEVWKQGTPDWIAVRSVPELRNVAGHATSLAPKLALKDTENVHAARAGDVAHTPVEEANRTRVDGNPVRFMRVFSVLGTFSAGLLVSNQWQGAGILRFALIGVCAGVGGICGAFLGFVVDRVVLACISFLGRWLR
jgi:hypothetical protein